jgi:hypothetical protein
MRSARERLTQKLAARKEASARKEVSCAEHSSVQEIADQKLQELANDPDNMVMRYVDRPKPEKLLPIQEVRFLIDEIWVVARNLTPQDLGNKDWGLQENAMRRQVVCLKDPRYLSFANTYFEIFDRLVAKESTPDMLQLMQTMCEWKFKVEKGKLTDSQGRQNFEEYLLKRHAVSKEEYMRKHPDATIHDAKSRQPLPGFSSA